MIKQQLMHVKVGAAQPAGDGLETCAEQGLGGHVNTASETSNNWGLIIKPLAWQTVGVAYIAVKCHTINYLKYLISTFLRKTICNEQSSIRFIVSSCCPQRDLILSPRSRSVCVK